jgi:DNA (cytosine-5)-methyltransferase 1
MRKIRVLSLFSGGGGLDIGFRQAGFEISASVEIDKQCCVTLESNSDFFGKAHKALCEDITKFSPREHGISDIDFIIGGPPCQSFSAAGRRAGGVHGINDKRGVLFQHYCRILSELRPHGFLFENVRGILSANQSTAWKEIVSEFGKLGYDLSFKVLDAAQYGVPQHRERLILIGSRKGCLLFPMPTHGPASASGASFVTAVEAVADLQSKSERKIKMTGKYAAALADIPPGTNYLHLTEKMGHPRPIFAWRSRFSDFLYVASPDAPTKTIVAQPGKWAGPFHWNKRRFTVAELKRLFTFPDSYKITGSEALSVKQLGNSVPPRLGRVLADAVYQQLFDKTSQRVVIADESHDFKTDQRKSLKSRATRNVTKRQAEIEDAKQLSLFSENAPNLKLPESRFVSKYWYSSSRLRHARPAEDSSFFEVKGRLASGVWSLNIDSKSAKKIKAHLEVNFTSLIAGAFRKIVVDARIPDKEFVGVLWDAVNEAISRASTYDSIHKLYGHFTEPHPRFSSKLRFLDPVASELNLLQIALESPDFLASYHKLAELKKICGVDNAPLVMASMLRESGYDIRLNATNRTIPAGFFRICYPFTMPIDAKTFTKWRNKGEHSTADFQRGGLKRRP